MVKARTVQPEEEAALKPTGRLRRLPLGSRDHVSAGVSSHNLRNRCGTHGITDEFVHLGPYLVLAPGSAVVALEHTYTL